MTFSTSSSSNLLFSHLFLFHIFSHRKTCVFLFLCIYMFVSFFNFLNFPAQRHVCLYSSYHCSPFSSSVSSLHDPWELIPGTNPMVTRQWCAMWVSPRVRWCHWKYVLATLPRSLNLSLDFSRCWCAVWVSPLVRSCRFAALLACIFSTLADFLALRAQQCVTARSPAAQLVHSLHP